jgi:hypothetical protein
MLLDVLTLSYMGEREDFSYCCCLKETLLGKEARIAGTVTSMLAASSRGEL